MELKQNDVIATWKTSIEIFGPTKTDNFCLSCTPDGARIDLWHVIESGRQIWVFYMIQPNVFNILVKGGTDKGATYLSTNEEGYKLRLSPNDDGSGRQRWTLDKVSDGVYNIKVFGGTIKRTFLSGWEFEDGQGVQWVDLCDKDDGSGRQQWKLKVPLIDVSFSLDKGEILQSTPEVIASQEIVNRTSIAQSMSFQVAQTVQETSFFETTLGVSMTVGASFECGVPFVGDTSISFELTTSFEQTYGKESSKSKSVTATFPVAAPPNKKVVCDAIVTKSKLEVPYTFTFADGSVQNGKWLGVSAWGLNAEFKEMAVDGETTEEEKE